jgi:hypothetical protein
VITPALIFALLGPAEDDVTPPPPPPSGAPAPAQVQTAVEPPAAATPAPAPAGPPITTAGPSSATPGADDNFKAKKRADRLEDLYERDNTFDANIDGGGGAAFGSDTKGMGFIRARAGFMAVRAPWFYMVGPTAEWSNVSGFAFGGQAEVMHLSSGGWAQLGGMVDTTGRPGGLLALGWSMIGVEGQVRRTEDIGTAVTVLGKLRIPIGVIVFAARQK